MYSVQEDGDPGLRERKRIATAAAIEEAAVRLVLERGYTDVTVDQICEAANISRRTFFNYFPSKEAAVLGPAAEEPDRDAAQDFLSKPSADIVADIVAIASTSLDKATTSDELLSARMDLMGTDPLMQQAQLARFSHLDEGLVALLIEHFEKYPRDRALGTAASAEREARLIVSIANGVLRYSIGQWLRSGRGAGRTQIPRTAVALIHRLFEQH